MAIFNSYVKLPEGTQKYRVIFALDDPTWSISLFRPTSEFAGAPRRRAQFCETISIIQWTFQSLCFFSLLNIGHSLKLKSFLSMDIQFNHVTSSLEMLLKCWLKCCLPMFAPGPGVLDICCGTQGGDKADLSTRQYPSREGQCMPSVTIANY